MFSNNFNRKLLINNENNEIEPNKILFFHIQKKGIQFGSFLGLGTTSLLYFMKKYTFKNAFIRGMNIGTIFGIFGANLLFLHKFLDNKLDEKGVNERALKLYNSKDQNLVDKITQISSSMGLAFGLLGIK